MDLFTKQILIAPILILGLSGCGGSGELDNKALGIGGNSAKIINQMSSGQYFVCAVVSGAAKCWGDNSYSQLGNPSISSNSSALPVAVSGLTSGVQAIAAGSHHACAIVNGGVRCWGDNTYGQLGGGTLVKGQMSAQPVSISGLESGVQALAAGNNHTCALSNGLVSCWGIDVEGQLGDNRQEYLSGHTGVVVQVTGLMPGIQAISAGGDSTCALASGKAFCWGMNGSGQVGTGLISPSSDVPVQVQGVPGAIEKISIGADHACASTENGAYCWGDNSWGKLGNNSINSSAVPVRVQGFDSGVDAVEVGKNFSCGLAAGILKCWGENDFGQLGVSSMQLSNSMVPLQINGLMAGITEISIGYTSACVSDMGRMQCWGNNIYSQLGGAPTGEVKVVSIDGL